MLKQITLNGKKVNYTLQRKKVKNVNLRIKADGTVTVSAGTRVSERFIENFLTSKADLILNALARFERRAENAPKLIRYENGDFVSVFGRDVPLEVVVGTKNTAEFDKDTIVLTVKDTGNLELKKKTLDKWLESACREAVDSLCASVYPAFEIYGIPYPQIKYRHMKSMWGNCRAERGILTFNYALVHAPMECIEYVVCHEFTHFLEPNHSAKFYDKLDSFLPDWKKRKRILESSGVLVR